MQQTNKQRNTAAVEVPTNVNGQQCPLETYESIFAPWQWMNAARLWCFNSVQCSHTPMLQGVGVTNNLFGELSLKVIHGSKFIILSIFAPFPNAKMHWTTGDTFRQNTCVPHVKHICIISKAELLLHIPKRPLFHLPVITNFQCWINKYIFCSNEILILSELLFLAGSAWVWEFLRNSSRLIWNELKPGIMCQLICWKPINFTTALQTVSYRSQLSLGLSQLLF